MSIRPRRLALRAVTVLAAAGTVATVTAVPAFAHVTAQPGQAEQGGYAVVSLRVPTESATAGTGTVAVTLPPLRSVRTTPTVQTYDDGEVVAWHQPPNPDGSEPEHPEPTVELLPAVGIEATADDTARWIGGGGLLVGALALGLGGGAVLQNRRTRSTR